MSRRVATDVVEAPLGKCLRGLHDVRVRQFVGIERLNHVAEGVGRVVSLTPLNVPARAEAYADALGSRISATVSVASSSSRLGFATEPP